jgi:hypothetical protein
LLNVSPPDDQTPKAKTLTASALRSTPLPTSTPVEVTYHFITTEATAESGAVEAKAAVAK